MMWGSSTRRCMLFLAGCLLASTTAAGQEHTPAYLSHGDDPMQQEYSAALLGFAFEKKCGFLAETERNAYEERLDKASDVFETYLLDQGIVQTRPQASSYSRDMALGAIRFAAASACDTDAMERVGFGFKLMRSFADATD